MSRVRAAWRAWVALMDRRESPRALALVRIAVAVVLLGDFAWTWHLGLVDPLWAPPPDGFATGFAGWAHGVGLTAFGLWGLAVALLLAIAVGLATPIACAGFVVVSAELSHIAPNGESGIDMVLRVIVAILALSRCDGCWSVKAWWARRRGRPLPALVPAWPRYLLLFQLVWIYFSGGHNKAGAAWGPFGGFAALGNALLDPHASRLDPAWVTAMFPLTRVATAATMVFELGAPLYLLAYYYAATADRPGRLRAWCNRLRIRWLWIGLGVAFELGIAATMRLGSFPFGMLALFPVLLLPRELARRRAAADDPADRGEESAQPAL